MDFYDINDNPIDHLTQWETGRKIKIKGLNSSKTYEAHVFNTRSKTAQVMSTTNSQGTITIEIIDRILQEPYMITVVVHEKTTSASIAVARIEIPVEEAARPEKYVPTDPERPPIAEYVLPIASDITLGGVKGKKKTNETVPVAIDIEGRMYVPTYPTNTGGGGSSTGGGTINEFVFGNLGFDTSKNGIDKGLSQEVYVPYDTVNKIKESDAIKLIFTGGDYLILYKTKKQGPGIKWNCVYTFLEPENGVYNKKIINYSLFAQDSSNSIIWGRDVWDIGTNGTGESYTLPVANASTLGGVKAKSKTSGDTVEVSADSTGKLYVPTYPAGGGSGGDVEPYVADFTGLTKLANIFAQKESATINYASLGKDIENTVDNVLASKKPIKFIFAGNNIVFNPIRIDANGEKTRFVFAEDIPYKKSFFVYSVIISSTPYSVIMNKIRSDDLQSASANSLGGIKADLKGSEYTVPVKIGDDAKLYVPTYPSGSGGSYTLPVANANTLGGVKAKTKTSNDTVEVSVDEKGKLYVPKYPSNTSTDNSTSLEPYSLIARLEVPPSGNVTVDKNINGEPFDINEFVIIVQTLQLLPQNTNGHMRIDIGEKKGSGFNSSYIKLYKVGRNPYIINGAIINSNVLPISVIANNDLPDITNSASSVFYSFNQERTNYINTINQFQFSIVNSDIAAASKVNIYGRKVVKGANVDEQKIVQDILNALPTWNGGEY